MSGLTLSFTFRHLQSDRSVQLSLGGLNPAPSSSVAGVPRARIAGEKVGCSASAPPSSWGSRGGKGGICEGTGHRDTRARVLS